MGRRYRLTASSTRESLLNSWEFFGSLYSPLEIERETRTLRRLVGQRLGGWRNEPARLISAEDETESDSLPFAAFDGMHLQEIGEAFGVSRERARQMIEGALAHLRHRSRVKRMLPFYDAVSDYRATGRYEDALIAMIDSGRSAQEAA